jgi:hypothetical protein
MNQSKHIDGVIASISMKTFYENGFIAALNQGLNGLLQAPKSPFKQKTYRRTISQRTTDE